MTNNIDSPTTAIPFIYLQNERFVVSQQAQQFLSSIKNPICVLTIVGKYRTGKSLFLNRIMLGKSKAFKVSPTINSCTRGLWLWKDKLKFQNEDQQKQVLIIDTEGFGATQQSDAYNNKILLFALLLSSYFVYNSVGSIDENSLNTISVLANLANEIQSKNSKDENIEQHFPSFLWLVRDFTLNLVDKNDFPIQAKEYLQQALQIQKGTSNLIEGKNRIRRMMVHFFTDRDCFTLVRPVQTQDKLQQLDTLEEKDFRETFLQQAKTLRQKILSKIKPKKLKNTLLTGQSLFELAKNYVDVINSNSLPNFQSSYKHLLKIEMNSMKKRISGQNQQKAKIFIKKILQDVKSIQEYESIKHNFLCEVEKLTKQKIKTHHSLSAFVNSQEIILLITEIKLTVNGIVDKFFNEAKQEVKHKYLSLVNEIKEDNLMSQSLDGIHNEREFKQFMSKLVQKMNSQVNKIKIPEFMQGEFYAQHFLPYIQSLQEEFSQLSTRRLSQQNKEMRIKLQMKQGHERQRQDLLMRIQNELKDERRMRSEWEMKAKMLERQLAVVKQNSIKKEQSATECIKRLQIENLNRQNQSMQLSKEIQIKTVQVNNSQETLQKTSSQLNLLDRQLALTKERLQSKSEQLSQKKTMVQGLNSILNDKNAKIESLSAKIQELRDSRQEILQKFAHNNQETSNKIINLQKNNSKLATELKQLKKLTQKSESQLNQTVKLLKEQLNQQKQKYQELIIFNQKITSTIQHLQEQLQNFNKKQEKYKNFKKCIKNSSSIQCLHCTKLLMSSIFLTHLSVCANFNQTEGQSAECCAQETEFKVINVVLHENNGKPFTVYQIQCSKGEKKWIIEKKFTEFCQLNENLQACLPGMELSSSKSIFDPKYLSKKSLSVEEKQFLIERYFNDLGKNNLISNNKYWLEFIYSKSEQDFPNSQPVTRRTVLSELNETVTNNQMLNYQMRKSQMKEEIVKSTNNHSSKKESLRTPQEFFKIWQQKQLRTKASSACLKKAMH